MTYAPRANVVDPETSRVITIADREWFVPVLTLRENRKVLPAILRLMPVMDRVRLDPTDADATLAAYSEENVENMVRAVHGALTRAYDITFEQFLDLPVNVRELMAAIPVVIEQTRFYQPAKPDEETRSAPGEEPATT